VPAAVAQPLGAGAADPGGGAGDEDRSHGTRLARTAGARHVPGTRHSDRGSRRARDGHFGTLTEP
jgi:hypothetical protein